MSNSNASTVPLVRRFERNPTGRDLVVGDIHGHFAKLQRELDAIGFNPNAGDRLFSVGDLVDRGPDSYLALEWLDQPWFHAVQGNHEDMAVTWVGGGLTAGMYRSNGGGWNMDNPREVQDAIAARFALLPVAMELQSDAGLLGIVHADCPFDDWPTFTAALESPALSQMERTHVIAMAQWSRNRCDMELGHGVGGVRAVIVGHTPMQNFTSLGNVLYIDTGGWMGRPFTILDANTLRPASPPGSLRW